MGKKIDLTGLRFNRWVVIREVGSNKQKSIMWECICDCGNTKVIDGNSLRSGNTQSCGCLNIEKIKERSISHGMSNTPTYSSWKAMVKRCNNPNGSDYKHYGGRGIKVCVRWLTFANFLEDMGEKPEGFTIERLDNNKGYLPGNCIFATRGQQAQNKRIYKNNKTGVKGVVWSEQNHKYRVRISANNKRYHIGFFAILQEAKTARLNAEKIYWRE